MSDRVFPDWLGAYITHTQHLESPDVFHFWTGVSCIAGALRRRVWMNHRYFQWTPNFYIIFVAPPGVVSKSTAITVGYNILRGIDGIHFGPNAITVQALVQKMASCAEGVIINEATGEYVTMSCLTIAARELGTLFDPNDRLMIDTLVDLWDGQNGSWDKMTKTSGNDSIENPWLNIIACTTPGWISEHMPESMVGGGFTSRCIFVYADKKRKLVAYPADHVPATFEQTEHELRRDLEVICTLKGEFTMSPDAKEFGDAWYVDMQTNIPAHLAGERLGGYVARKQSHVHKLAMILSAAKRSDLVIELEDFRAAIGIVDATEHEMQRAFSRVGQSQTGRRISEVVDIVRSHKEIEIGALLRMMIRTIDYKEFETVLNSAITAGLIEKRQIESRIMIRSLK